ncbi:hypothetical protein GDO78_021679, partial [Eleutherodactylus coqui]
AVLDVSVEPDIVAKPGDTVKLKCALQGIKDLDLKKLMIQWYTKGKLVAEYDNKINIEKTGLSMSLDALKTGDATLTIQSFTTDQAGKYRCYVTYKAEDTVKQISLSSTESVAQVEKEVDLTTCETILDKKLDKVIDLISKVEGKLVEVTKSCSTQQVKTHGK